MKRCSAPSARYFLEISLSFQRRGPGCSPTGFANGGFGQQRRHESRRMTLEIGALGWMSTSRRSTLPMVWHAGHNTSSTADPAAARS
jgi:hypothetical protein